MFVLKREKKIRKRKERKKVFENYLKKNKSNLNLCFFGALLG